MSDDSERTPVRASIGVPLARAARWLLWPSSREAASYAATMRPHAYPLDY
jgi:hypothetical protein